jgi:hypothetical protein
MEQIFLIADIDPRLLAAERDRVLAVLKEVAPEAEIFEVGSTAVAGVIGKGDIDILVRADAARFGAVRSRLDMILARNPDQLSNEIYQGYLVGSPLEESNTSWTPRIPTRLRMQSSIARSCSTFGANVPFAARGRSLPDGFSIMMTLDGAGISTCNAPVVAAAGPHGERNGCR